MSSLYIVFTIYLSRYVLLLLYNYYEEKDKVNSSRGLEVKQNNLRKKATLWRVSLFAANTRSTTPDCVGVAVYPVVSGANCLDSDG